MGFVWKICSSAPLPGISSTVCTVENGLPAAYKVGSCRAVVSCKVQLQFSTREAVSSSSRVVE